MSLEKIIFEKLLNQRKEKAANNKAAWLYVMDRYKCSNCGKICKKKHKVCPECKLEMELYDTK